VKRWLQPARALPVTLRPVGGETVNSYALRLSVANGLIPTAILRSLGQLTERSGHLLARDSWLNDQALARLEAFSGISRLRLLRALPALRQGAPSSQLGPLPDDRPALHCYIPQPRPWPACRLCTLRGSLGTTPTALVRPPVSPLICRRHRRWLGTSDEPADTDISAVPEILTAYRRFQRLRLNSSDLQTAADCIQAAWNITRVWAREPHCRPRLRARWRARAGNLGPDTALSSRVVTFPEAVALAEILTDPDWRHHVATVPARHAGQFYRRVCARLGEGTYQAPADDDPVVAWAGHHRSTFTGREALLSSQQVADHSRPAHTVAVFTDADSARNQ
jgi:hypothetical protein